MAEVWLGTDLSLSRQVAVKLLKPNLATDPIVAERFRREAIAVAQLNHQNIVAVYDAIDDNGRQAVVMQLVNGKSLRQLLDEQKRLSPDLTIHIGSCVASALDAAHRAGMVHRDVKPGNILITPDGRVLLTDFGIAKGLEPTGDDLTNDNIMMGTAKYLSPEQVRGKRLDGRADLYSLGLVLYECLAGRVPFLGQNDADTALARLQRDPTDLTRLRPTLPKGLPEVIHKLLARRPDQRFPTGAALKSALNEIGARAHEPVVADETDQRPTRRTPVVPPKPTDPTQRGPYDQGAPTPPRAPQPKAVGGYQPVRTTGQQPRTGGRPAGAPVRSPDRTPTGQSRVQQRPNRQFEHRRSPSLVVVGGLLLAAVIVSAVLWTTLGGDDDQGTRLEPTGGSEQSAATSGTALLPNIGASAFVAAVAYDPEGDDGQENDDQATFVLDGDRSTGWSTSCYKSISLGNKTGVGVVVTLPAPTAGRVLIDIASSPWKMQVFATQNAAIPDSIMGWGSPVATDSATEPDLVDFQLTAPALHILVLMQEGGDNGGCPPDMPYRATINEVQLEVNEAAA
ncbi:MAG: protein kinase [Actinobacteria bacterium]|nr:protein kinase [Actinomycetota bacterium]